LRQGHAGGGRDACLSDATFAAVKQNPHASMMRPA
jgi:hypothetical protein